MSDMWKIFYSSSVCSFFASGFTYPIELIKINYQNSKEGGGFISIIRKIYKIGGFSRFFRGALVNATCFPIFWSIFFTSRHILDSNYSYNKSNLFISSTIASTLSNPFFVIKNRMQTKFLFFNSKICYVNIIKHIYEYEGLYGYTKGITSTIINNSKIVINFTLLEYFHNNDNNNNNIFVVALFSKLFANNIAYPLDLIRTKQRSNYNEYLNMTYLIKDIYKRNGFFGFYKGNILYNCVTIPNFLIMIFFKNQFDNYN
jgi:hypothetical protein